jgi:hypothetical protein
MADVPSDLSVRLSVMPDRRAVVVVDVGADAPSGALDPLVQDVIRDAFVFDAVDVVEVRRPNGELVDRRRRRRRLLRV